MPADFPDQADLVLEQGYTPGKDDGSDSDRGRRMLDFVVDLRRDFEKRDAGYKMIDEVIYLEQKVQIPENFKNTAIEVRSPMPTHIANSITAALSINQPQVQFHPIEFGDAGEDNAAYRERFFEAAWIKQQREKKRRTHRIFMHSVVTKGEGILKTHERKLRAWAKYVGKGEKGQDGYEEGYLQRAYREAEDALSRGDLPDEDAKTRLFDKSTEEYKRGLPYPIETSDIPPETFYYQKGEDGFVRVAEVKEVPYYETLKRYGRSFDGKGRVCLDDITGIALPDDRWGEVFGRATTSRRTIQMVELWDSEYCTIILRGPGDFPSAGSGRTGSGQVVQRYKHGYGDPHLGVLRGPYFHAPGIITSSREPHKAHLSVLFAYLHLFPLLNALLTMQSQAAFSFSYPAYRRTTPPNYGLPDVPFGYDAADMSAAREKIIPGAIFPHDIAPMDQPTTSVDLDKAINFVRQLIDMALPDAVQGVITGETAGYALNQAAHLASLAWSPIVDNVEDALSDRVGWESELIETRIGEPVYVWGAVPQPVRRKGQREYKDGWLGIGPKDLKGVHNYRVKLEPASVNNETLKLRVIEQKLQMRLITPPDAIREIGGNPAEVERGWLLHELKQDPEIRKNLKQRIFFGISTIEQEEMRQLPPEAQPGGAPPTPQLTQPAGAQPGVSQGIPTTGFVPPAGAVPGAPPAAPPPPAGVPGTAPGEPGGVRGAPASHSPIPGGGG